MRQTHHWGRILCPGRCQAEERTRSAGVAGAMIKVLPVTGRKRGLGVAAVALLRKGCARDFLATWRVFCCQEI